MVEIKFENSMLDVEDEPEEDASPALLLNTVSMIVIASVPPRGTAKLVSEMTEAMLLGKKPIP